MIVSLATRSARPLKPLTHVGMASRQPLDVEGHDLSGLVAEAPGPTAITSPCWGFSLAVEERHQLCRAGPAGERNLLKTWQFI